MNFKELKFPLVLAFTAALMGGCVGQKSIVELETQTSLNAAALSTQLKAFGANHEKIVSARKQTYADEVAVATDLQSKLDSLVAIQRIAGNTDTLKIYQDTLAESDLEQRNHDTNVNLLAETLAQMDQGVAKVKAPTKELDAIAKNLVDIANQETIKNRAKELAIFYTDVAGQVQAHLQAQDEARRKAMTSFTTNSMISSANNIFKNLLK